MLELGRWGKPRLKKSFIKSRSFATPPAVDAVPQAGNQICKSDSLLPHSELHTAAPPIEFSVSHSGETGLIGLSRLPIGVDIEFLKPRISLASLSNMVLSDSESQVWKLLPSQKRQHQMLRLWVCKEAVLKAMGLGIAECLQQVSFPIPVPEANVFSPIWIDPAIQIHLEEESSCSQNSWLQSQSWGIHNISEIENYTAAVAVLDRQACCESRDFNWSTALPL